jgi:hypothetical protein
MFHIGHLNNFFQSLRPCASARDILKFRRQGEFRREDSAPGA